MRDDIRNQETLNRITIKFYSSPKINQSSIIIDNESKLLLSRALVIIVQKEESLKKIVPDRLAWHVLGSC